MEISLEKNVERCPNCDSSNIIEFGDRHHFRWKLKYKLCGHCSFIFQSPQMHDDITNIFYEEEYPKLYKGQEDPREEDLNIQGRRGSFQVNYLLSYLEKYDRESVVNCLDIGCSTGSMLSKLKHKLPQIEVVGVEPANEYRSFCTSKGIRTYADVKEVVAAGEKFDVVVMSHVLEHIPRPVEFLTLIRDKILKANGILLIEVPNTLGGHGAFEIAHPVCFYDKTLKDTLKLAGFGKIKLTKHSVTQEENESDELYLLTACTTLNGVKKKIKKVNPWWIMFLRRRTATEESLIISLKYVLKAMLRHKKILH